MRFTGQITGDLQDKSQEIYRTNHRRFTGQITGLFTGKLSVITFLAKKFKEYDKIDY